MQKEGVVRETWGRCRAWNEAIGGGSFGLIMSLCLREVHTDMGGIQTRIY